MPVAPTYFTAEMARALPDDGNRYEVVWGELLVNPSPVFDHQAAVGNVFLRLTDFCQRTGYGRAMLSPADISWSEDTLVQPDVFVMASDEAATRNWRKIRTLLLVVEGLSPSTAKHDRFQKRKLCQAHGVGTLWLVDPAKRVVEVWTPERLFPAVETERLRWHPTGAAKPLIIGIDALFA